jgi:hypothetical protein
MPFLFICLRESQAWACSLTRKYWRSLKKSFPGVAQAPATVITTLVVESATLGVLMGLVTGFGEEIGWRGL